MTTTTRQCAQAAPHAAHTFATSSASQWMRENRGTEAVYVPTTAACNGVQECTECAQVRPIVDSERGRCTECIAAAQEPDDSVRPLQVRDVQHVDSGSAYVEAGRVAREGGVVSDAVAVTVASWWASPGAGGRALAALSTGAPTTVEAVHAEVVMLQDSPAAGGDWRDAQALEALRDWLEAR